MKLTQGDLFDYLDNDNVTYMVAHIVNNQGLWGAGFVVSLSQYCVLPEKQYRMNYKNFSLGQNQYCLTQKENIVVCNMFAQNNFLFGDKLDYNALNNCLHSMYFYCNDNNYKYIFMPKIGSGIAGGCWEPTIVGMIESCENEFNYQTQVFYL